MNAAFNKVVKNIVSTRSFTYWDHAGLVHLHGRAPDGKTECGLQTNMAELYLVRRGPQPVVTCEACEQLSPPAVKIGA